MFAKKGATLISIQMVILGADLAVCSLSHPERILGINYVNRNIFATRLMEMGNTIGLPLITESLLLRTASFRDILLVSGN